MDSPSIYPPVMGPRDVNLFIRCLKAIPKGQVYLEVGTYYGGSLCTAALNTVQQQTELYGIDVFHVGWGERSRVERGHPAHPIMMLFENINAIGREHAGRICLIPTDSNHVGVEHPILKALAGRVGLLLIDANHTYDSVRNDAKFIQLVADGGTVLFHDYLPAVFPGVVKAVNEILETGVLESTALVGSLIACRMRGGDLPRFIAERGLGAQARTGATA